ncbi:hypothetical protein [Caballeronia eucalypticola]|uniref:hypothetical protein n=1 Tax=Caballeronia sp. 15715 TaxID=3391030 RepID=UPI0039E4444A
MKFGHDFLKIQWLLNVDQQRVFDLEESVWTVREKKNGLRFRIYWTKMSAIERVAVALPIDAAFFGPKKITLRYRAYRMNMSAIAFGMR